MTLAPPATAGAHPLPVLAMPRAMPRAMPLAMLLAGGLAGCTALPAAAPTTAEIRQASEREDSPFPFEIVEMNETVAAALEPVEPPGLAEVFGNGSGASFRIRPGDTLNLTVYETVSGGAAGGLFAIGGAGAVGATEAKLPPLTVPADGRVTVPFVGRIRVTGRTADEVAQIVQDGLAGQAIDPQVVVGVDKPASNAVTVVGDAGAGGVVQLSPGAERLSDAIAATGGISAPVNEVIVRLARGKGQHEIPLARVLDDVGEDIRLSPGDRITLDRRPAQYVAIGALGTNALLPIGKAPFTLADAIGASRGLIDGLADPDGVYVLRLEDRDPAIGAGTAIRPVAYQFKMRDISGVFLARRFAIRPDDIVFTANAPATVVRKFFGVFSGFTGQVGAVTSIAQ
ncbi:MAG: polysaccharide biosynthesis/export family protein [Pseudomonadota bacterium]